MRRNVETVGAGSEREVGSGEHAIVPESEIATLRDRIAAWWASVGPLAQMLGMLGALADVAVFVAPIALRVRIHAALGCARDCALELGLDGASAARERELLRNAVREQLRAAEHAIADAFERAIFAVLDGRGPDVFAREFGDVVLATGRPDGLSNIGPWWASSGPTEPDDDDDDEDDDEDDELRAASAQFREVLVGIDAADAYLARIALLRAIEQEAVPFVDDLAVRRDVRAWVGFATDAIRVDAESAVTVEKIRELASLVDALEPARTAAASLPGNISVPGNIRELGNIRGLFARLIVSDAMAGRLSGVVEHLGALALALGIDPAGLVEVAAEHMGARGVDRRELAREAA